MSHYMTALAMKQTGLKPATKIVLYWLADHHNGETGRCFPSLNRLAFCCEMNKSTVVRHIDTLERLDLVQRIKTTRPDGGYASTSYNLFPLRVKINEALSQNTTSPSSNSAYTLVAKCNTNLGSNNFRSNNTFKDKFSDEFWEAYPKKMAKGQAKRAWAKAFILDHPQEIVEAAKRYAKAQDGKDKQFIPYPASWLNAERWKDEPEEQKEEIVNMAAVFLKGAING